MKKLLCLLFSLISISLLAQSPIANIALRNIGPAKSSGRISDIAIDPNMRSTWYVATASGNVWKTMNAGTTWEPVFERYGSYSTGTIEVDPNNSNVIWLGTGENNAQRSVGFGDGIYKSMDAGKTWKNMGLKTSEHIGKIVIDPRNSNVVFVAAQGPVWKSGGERGLYKTMDGGETWERILFVSENAGISDIIYDPRNPDVMLVSSYQRRRHFGMMVAGGPDGGIWKTVDGGKNWKKLKIASGDLGRIGLAISPQKPNVVYAQVAGTDKTHGFYRSENQGDTWKKVNSFKTMDAQYYMEVFADPHQFDRVLFVDFNIQVSEDGGKNFKPLPTRGKHVDNHHIEFDPNNPNYLLVGCDGGIYESWDKGQTWKFFDNLQIVQFYRVGIDNAWPFYNVYGGTQDNATLGGPSQTPYSTGIRNYDWYITRGGDGFQTRVDPGDPNIVYSESQYAGIVRYDRRSGESVDIQPQPGAGEPPLRWNWDAPLLISHHKNERLYFAANKVFKSEDRGSTWEAISPDLTKQLDRNKMEVMDRVWGIDAVFKNVWTSPYGTIVAMDESPRQEGLIYVGTDDGLLQVTEDGGTNWRKGGAMPGLPEKAYASDVHASPTDENVVYAIFNNHKYGDFTPYIYKSKDKGRTWSSISGNLKSPEFAWSIKQDHIKDDLLFVGTEFGLWASLDGGKEWTKFKKGIPTIAIRDLEIQERENDLVMASFGRGFFILDDYSLLREINEESLTKDHDLYPVKDALSYVQHNPESRSLGNMHFTSPNPPYGAVISYYNKSSAQSLKQQRASAEKEMIKKKEPVYYPDWEAMNAENRESRPTMVLSIKDVNGNVVRRIMGPASKGIHRVAWDLRLAGSGQGRQAVGPPAAPGHYAVSLAKVINGQWTEIPGEQSFHVVRWVNGSLPMANPADLTAFQNEVFGLRKRISRLNTVLGAATEDMEKLQQLLMQQGESNGTSYAKANEIEHQLRDMDIALNGNRFAVSKMELIAPSPSARLGRIARSFYSYRGQPTQTNRDSFVIAKQETEALIDQLKSLIQKEIEPLEKKAKDMGIEYYAGAREL